MYLNKSILEDVREAVGLTSDTTDYDTELIMHINTAIGKLNQNGVGRFFSCSEQRIDLGTPTRPNSREG